MWTSNLAFRIPFGLGVVVLLSGCYTMLKHPQGDVTEYSARSYRTDCGSCHTSGFEQRLLPDSYPYVAAPFQDFYDTPWWLPDYGAGLFDYPVAGGGYVVAPGEDKESRQGGAEGRHVGSRGHQLPALPPGPSTTPTSDSPTPGATTPAASDNTAPATGEGQQPGRTMKEDDPGDSQESPKKPAEPEEKPSDGGGG